MEDVDKSCKISKERHNYRQLCHTVRIENFKG